MGLEDFYEVQQLRKEFDRSACSNRRVSMDRITDRATAESQQRQRQRRE